MATFQITGPNGKKYRVQGENAEGAFRALQQHLGAVPQQESQASADTRNELSALTQGMAGELPGGNLAAARYEAMPAWQKPLQAADDTARLLASGLTFGYADKLAGYLGGEGTEAERERTQQARDRAGAAGTAAEIAGAVAVPMAAASKGVTLAGRLGTGGMTGAKGLLARSALMGAEGAGYGALTAAGNDQDISEGAGYGAVGGALGNVAGEAISAGVGKVAGLFNKKPDIPSVEKLRDMAKSAYDKADNAGVIFNPQGIQRLSTDIKTQLADFGFDPALQPRIMAVINRLDDLSQSNVTLKGMDTLRKVANNARLSQDPSERMIGGRVIEALDDFVENVRPGEVMAGDAQKGAEALKEARELWSRVRKTEMVEGAVEKAELRAASTGAGGNADNATRQNLRRILEKERGLKPDERKALETVVRGTPGQNALRLAGKFAPTGVVSGVLSGGAGLGLLGPAGLAIPLAGAGAKAVADRMTGKNVNKLVEILRAGGNASATQAAPNLVQRLAQSKREALARFLMGIGAYEAGTR